MKHIAFLSIFMGFVGSIGCSDDLSTIEVQNPPETSSTNPVIDGEKTTPKEPAACHDSDCPEGEKCKDGSCQPICDDGTTYCDGKCFDFAVLHLAACHTVSAK